MTDPHFPYCTIRTRGECDCSQGYNDPPYLMDILNKGIAGDPPWPELPHAHEVDHVARARGNSAAFTIGLVVVLGCIAIVSWIMGPL